MTSSCSSMGNLLVAWLAQNHIAAVHKWLSQRVDRGGGVVAGMAWTCWWRMCWTRAMSPSRTTA